MSISNLTPIFSNPNEFILDFSQFIKEYNVVGLGIGALVANNTMDIGKAIVDSLIMPIVTGIITRSTPTFTYYGLIQSMITFLVTMFVIFFLMRIFGIKATKPVSYVRVVNEGYMDYNNGGENMNLAMENAYNNYENKNQ
jgi:large-conductance mechanosensitive channel